MIKEILKEDIFSNVTYEECLDNVVLIKDSLDKLKTEYAFRVHMENGLESYEGLQDIIKDYVKVYNLVIKYKRFLDKKGISDNLNVKDLSDNEEYHEKYLLNIPNRIIPMTEKVKTK